MIVLPEYEGWNIIFQRNHALLATKIALEISPSLRPEPWTELLVAIAEHDDGQAPWSSDRLLNEKGEPQDFSQLGFYQEQAEQVVKNAFYKSSWISLLTSLHTSMIYSDFPEAAPFLQRQSSLQRSLLDRIGISYEKAYSIYSFMKWCDELSLLLCRDRINGQKKMTIGQLPDGITRDLEVINGTLEVRPWCFFRDNFSLSAEVYPIDQKTFSDAEELHEKIKQCNPTEKVWSFVRETVGAA
jgi:hypothetical protein